MSRNSIITICVLAAATMGCSGMLQASTVSFTGADLTAAINASSSFSGECGPGVFTENCAFFGFLVQASPAPVTGLTAPAGVDWTADLGFLIFSTGPNPYRFLTDADLAGDYTTFLGTGPAGAKLSSDSVFSLDLDASYAAGAPVELTLTGYGIVVNDIPETS